MPDEKDSLITLAGAGLSPMRKTPAQLIETAKEIRRVSDLLRNALIQMRVADLGLGVAGLVNVAAWAALKAWGPREGLRKLELLTGTAWTDALRRAAEGRD
jgi:hypothetical protein